MTTIKNNPQPSGVQQPLPPPPTHCLRSVSAASWVTNIKLHVAVCLITNQIYEMDLSLLSCSSFSGMQWIYGNGVHIGGIEYQGDGIEDSPLDFNPYQLQGVEIRLHTIFLFRIIQVRSCVYGISWYLYTIYTILIYVCV